MDVRILGDLQVFEGDREIAVKGRKQRALLALLLLRANRAVSEDALIEALWGERASSRAGNNLHVLVSRLRGVLGCDRVVRTAGGYLIRLEEGELDLERFEALRRDQRFDEALALWRDPPLAEFAYEPWAASEIGRLEELRLLVLEERIETDLASGKHAELVGELRSLLAEHPLRETLRRHLIVALYRCGRQAEALEAYRDTRRMLNDELGLEPTPALRELEGAVLRQDPELNPPPSRVRALVAPEGRRRAALVAVAAAVLGFAGAASAVLVLQRDGGELSAAPLPVRATTASAPTEAPAVTAPAIVIRARPKPPRAEPRTPSRTKARPEPAAAAPAPPPPPAAAHRATPMRTPQSVTRTPKTQPPAAPVPTETRIEDTFDDGVIDRTVWHRSAGTGVTVEEVDGRLEIAIAPTAVAEGDDDLISGALTTNCRYLGDFEVRVDFQLLDWPAASGVIGQLASWYNAYAATVGRFSNNLGAEEYAGWFPGALNSFATDHREGALRILHRGTLSVAQYRVSGRWQPLVSARVTGAPTIGLQLMSRDDWFAHEPVRIAFDNFVLTARKPVC